MRYLLSIHDVWPGNFPLVEGYLARLRSVGASRAALMVVPRYHDRRPVSGEREFLAWLEAKSAEGAEIFLHGYRHLMPERAGVAGRRGAWGRWVNRRLVGGEAEFCGLARRERERLLALGLEAFREAGIRAEGFVAPTWHGAPPRESLRASGLPLWETRFRIHDLARGISRFAPPLAWNPPAGGRDASLFGGGPWLAALLRLPLIKVVVHPGDLGGRAVLETVARVAGLGEGVAYREALGMAGGGAQG